MVTDKCTYAMPLNGVARYILWTLWLGYTVFVLAVTDAVLFVSASCLTWLWIVSIFILTTESLDFRVFLVSLWGVTVIVVFFFPTPPVSLVAESAYFVVYLLSHSPSTPLRSLAVTKRLSYHPRASSCGYTSTCQGWAPMDSL
jgi:hypothetical protein